MSINSFDGDYSYIREDHPHLKKLLVGGWSFGGLIAYEMARQLSVEKEKAPLVVILDQPIPLLSKKVLPYSESDSYIEKFIKQVEGFNEVNLGIEQISLKWSSFEKQTNILYHAFVEKRLLPSNVSEEDFFKFLQLQKIQNKASYQYMPGRYEGPVLLIRGQNSHWESMVSPSLGWEDIVTNLITKKVSGTHISMMKTPNIQQISYQIEEWIISNHL